MDSPEISRTTRLGMIFIGLLQGGIMLPADDISGAP
ncbi:Uncharacterised protein [Citrobacter freundii]|nr:Uncharacterised protein [Citrobacter freundii]